MYHVWKNILSRGFKKVYVFLDRKKFPLCKQ